MPAGRSPAARWVGAWRVGEELLCALDFTFLQGTFLQDKASLPRRGRKPEGLEQAPQRLRMAEWLLVHGLERTFRLDSIQRGDGFSERARK